MFPTKPVSPRSTCQVWYNRRPQPRALTLSAGEAMASRIESWRTGTRIWRDTHWLYISSMVCCKIHHLIRNCPIYRTINLYRGFPLPRLFYRKVVFWKTLVVHNIQDPVEYWVVELSSTTIAKHREQIIKHCSDICLGNQPRHHVPPKKHSWQYTSPKHNCGFSLEFYVGEGPGPHWQFNVTD